VSGYVVRLGLNGQTATIDGVFPAPEPAARAAVEAIERAAAAIGVDECALLERSITGPGTVRIADRHSGIVAWTEVASAASEPA
jgi:hypothetical protein